ncbi:MAG TPA: hypothetical protein VIM29_11320 [Bacillota bacterium]
METYDFVELTNEELLSTDGGVPDSYLYLGRFVWTVCANIIIAGSRGGSRPNIQ